MRSRRTGLTTRQLDVLRWVADGCPDGIWSGQEHKHSARALEARHLVVVKRQAGKWHAVLRSDGRYYLDHGDYPPRRDAAGSAVDRSKPPPRPSPSAVARPQPPQRRPAAPRVSPTTQLIADIQAAGGTLTWTYRPGKDRELQRLDAQIRAARRFNKVPDGYYLVVDQPRWGTRIISLAPLPDWMTPTLQPVPVPTQLRRPHAAVGALRDSRSFDVTKAVRPRALRLLHALATAAEAHGHRVTGPTRHSESRHPAYLHFDVRGHDIELCLTQEQDRTGHVATARERAELARHPWTRIPEYDFAPSERLRIDLPGRFEQRQATWSDGARSKLEDRLGEMLQEMELRSIAAERRRLADEERRRQEKLAEQQRIARATIKLIESHRAEVLTEQVDNWHQAKRLGAYLEAMTEHLAALDSPDDRAAGEEWLAWARRYAARLDPLQHRLAMPADPEPTYAALAPFMERRSIF